MIPVSDLTALVKNRASLYSLLARIYRIEADQALLAQMAQMDLSVEVDQPDLASGYQRLGRFLAHPGSEVLTDLAVDYARVFLAAGITEGNAAFPYESVYTSPEHLIMQDARDQVVAFYYAEELDEADDLGVPEDHIALELEFMAHLSVKTQDALAANDLTVAVKALETQQTFLEQHLANWVPAFTADIEKYSGTDFYRAAAQITRGLLTMDAPLIDQLIDETRSLTLAPASAVQF